MNRLIIIFNTIPRLTILNLILIISKVQSYNGGKTNAYPNLDEIDNTSLSSIVLGLDILISLYAKSDLNMNSGNF